MVGNTERGLPPEGEWGEVVRSAVACVWGTITARRIAATERLTLQFNEEFGFLEHWASDDGPVSLACFPNRAFVTDARVELRCCCGIPIEVRDRYVLP
jgi:hypothetical protein